MRTNIVQTAALSHFGLALHVGDVAVPLRLQALALLLAHHRLGLLTLLLRLGQSLLAQLAGQGPGERQAAAIGHVSQLFGTVGGGVGLVDVVEAVVVHLIKAVLQCQHRREAVAPLDLAANVGAPRLAGHAWSHSTRRTFNVNFATIVYQIHMQLSNTALWKHVSLPLCNG